MKILIDIPEKIEEYIKDYIPIGAGNNVFCYPDEIVRMIQNGTPIPDNVPTVDVLDKIRAEIEKMETFGFCIRKEKVLQIIDHYMKGE